MNRITPTVPGLVWMLAALTALAPLAVDAYLPAFPAMAHSLAVPVQQIELTLSLFLAGFALGQLVGGSVSDHYGRRRAIFLGLSLFALGTLLILFSGRIDSIWLGRFIQALGGGISVVNSAAIVRDLHSGRDSARALSRIAAIMMMAPMLAPVLGSLLLALGGWRTIFAFLFLYALLLSAALWYWLPETRCSVPTPHVNPLRRYLHILRQPTALGYLLSVACGYAMMFAFITGSAAIYMKHYQIPPLWFPLLFGANVVALLLCNRINIRLLQRLQPRTLLQRAQWAQLLLGLVAIIALSFYALPVGGFLPLVMLMVGLQGFVVSNGMAATTELFPHSAASATALVGAAGFGCGAISGTLVGLLGDGSPLPVMIIMTLAVATGITLRSALHRNRHNSPTPMGH